MIRFNTANGEFKQIGRGRGPIVTYFFSKENQFSGILSYEIDGDTYAFGSLDSRCNHLTEADI